MDLWTRFEGVSLTVGPSNGPTVTVHGVAEVPGGGQGPSSGGAFVPWLDEMANVGAQRVGFAPRLDETADVGAQRAGFAPWLDEMANAGALRAGFAPWLCETANVRAQRVGFAPTSVKMCQLYREMVG